MEHGGELFELGDELGALFVIEDTDALSKQCSVTSFQQTVFSIQ